MTVKLKFNSGRYAMYKWENDSAVMYCGDTGGSLLSLDPTNGKAISENGEIIVGSRIQCGSLYARSYQQQDWWMTSIVTGILEKHDKWALIKTKNSTYIVGEADEVLKVCRGELTAALADPKGKARKILDEIVAEKDE